MAERLGYGLQIRLQRFNSASHLQFSMITIWGLILGLPLLAFGGACLLSPACVHRFTLWFRTSSACAWLLTTVAWLWAAFECSVIGIDFVDTILLKEKTGGLFVWVLAVVLIFLTVQWMPRWLPVRALTGILMLFPAQLFKCTRVLLPESGFARVHILVVIAYLAAVIGMYGMFYPWRLEKAADLVLVRPWAARLLGAACVLLALASLVAGFTC